MMTTVLLQNRNTPPALLLFLLGFIDQCNEPRSGIPLCFQSLDCCGVSGLGSWGLEWYPSVPSIPQSLRKFRL